jgi:hypothetical protein
MYLIIAYVILLLLCGSAAPNVPFTYHPDVIWVNMEQRWNETDRGKPKDSEKNLS